MRPSDAALSLSLPARSLWRALARIGWEARAIEVDAGAGTARVELRRDNMLVTLDARNGTSTITRERITRRTETIGRRGDRARVERIGTEFIGRDRYTRTEDALCALAAYVEDNGIGATIAAEAAVPLIGRRRVRSSDAIAIAVRALEAGFVLHAFDSYSEQACTAGRNIRAVGPSDFAFHSYGLGNGTEPAASLEFSSACELARYLVGTRVVPGPFGTYPTWGAATVALKKAGLE